MTSHAQRARDLEARIAQLERDTSGAQRELVALGNKAELTTGESERFERQMRHVESTQKRIADLRQAWRDEITTALAERDSDVTEYDGTPRTADRDVAVSGARGRALAALESKAQPLRNRDVIEAAVQMIEKDVTGRLAERASVTGDPAYASAFAKLLRDPERGHLVWTRDEQAAWMRVDQYSRAISEGSTGAGGALVPFALDPTVVITGTGSINPLRQIARAVTVSTNAWHGVTAGQVSASFDQEMAEVSDDSPTFVQPTVTEFMERIFIPASLELIDDVPTLTEQIAVLFADAVDNLERDKFTNGVGTNEPAGVVHQVQNTTASRVSVGTGGAFNQPDLYKLIEALPPRHQDPAQWMGSLPILNKIRAFATGSGPQSAFWTDWAGPQLAPAKLLGLPIWQNSAMVTTVTTGADFLLVGNFDRFLIADHVGGARLEVIPQLLGLTSARPVGMRVYFMYKRTGSNVTDADAFRILRA